MRQTALHYRRQDLKTVGSVVPTLYEAWYADSAGEEEGGAVPQSGILEWPPVMSQVPASPCYHLQAAFRDEGALDQRERVYSPEFEREYLRTHPRSAGAIVVPPVVRYSARSQRHY